MRHRVTLAALALAVATASPFPASAQSADEELRIGVLVSLTGGGAIIGKEVQNGWNLAMKHEGWTENGDKLGGVPTRIFFADDQLKPDVALRQTRKLLQSDKVHIVSGILWSHVAMAIARPITRAHRIMLSVNAGPSPLAGRQCSRYFVSTSWQGDQVPEAMGQLLREEGLKSVYLMAPNYQAGKDVLAGFERFYEGGKVVGRTLFKIGETDYQADISRIRAANPEAVVIFAPGGMGVAFMKQWAVSGMRNEVKLYTIFVVNNLTLPAIGEAAVGTFHTDFWNPTSEIPANERFVKDFTAAHGRPPSMFAAQAYDAPRLIAAALMSLDGKFSDGGDMLPLAKALRTVSYDSVRGAYGYNVNGFPIQDYIKREVIAGPDGKPKIVGRDVVFEDHKDHYWQQCPEAERFPQ